MNAITNHLQFPISAVEYNGVQKPLDHQFGSFGEAASAWLNSEGYGEQATKSLDAHMVRGFCEALQRPYVVIQFMRTMPFGTYFETDDWVFKHLEEKGYHRLGSGSFILLDEFYRPISYVAIGSSHHVNADIDVFGDEVIVLEWRELVKKHLKQDPTAVMKPSYMEAILHKMHDSITYQGGAIENERIALPEYYPYLSGGVLALLKDFMESEESVLIIQGPPGTGKTSGVSAGIVELNMMPIYAKKSEVVAHKDFVSSVFRTSDEYMARVVGTDANNRKKLFLQETIADKEYGHSDKLIKEDEEHPRVPVVVVEDADVLIASRKDGNPLMAELLNETDGLGSNHARKIIFNTNITDLKLIDEALMRPGRCYAVVNFRLLTAEEAIKARRAADLPDFDNPPTKDVSLAEALRKPRKRISVSGGKAAIGFGS